LGGRKDEWLGRLMVEWRVLKLVVSKVSQWERKKVEYWGDDLVWKLEIEKVEMRGDGKAWKWVELLVVWLVDWLVD
jgi:hypothetical protein